MAGSSFGTNRLYIVHRRCTPVYPSFKVPYILHFQPSLDTLSLRTDVKSSIKTYSSGRTGWQTSNHSCGRAFSFISSPTSWSTSSGYSRPPALPPCRSLSLPLFLSFSRSLSFSLSLSEGERERKRASWRENPLGTPFPPSRGYKPFC